MKSNAGTKGRKVRFALAAEPGVQVFVAGTFNNWDPSQHRMQDDPAHGGYRIALTLPPGRHEYKFIVNGDWVADPACADWQPNGLGTLNSVVSV